MSKINLTYNKVEYSLEYSRQSVKIMESQGFVLDEITSKPMTMLPMLFSGAFIKNHKGMKRNLIDEIFENIGNKSDLIAALAELYAETLSFLTEDGTADEGNVVWAKVN